jgi:hypothetical protein
MIEGSRKLLSLSHQMRRLSIVGSFFKSIRPIPEIVQSSSLQSRQFTSKAPTVSDSKSLIHAFNSSQLTVTHFSSLLSHFLR